jgi:hypothetical protein
MLPVLRRTWAPCGTTPTFSVRARSHEKVSGICALVVSPHRQQITLALALYPRLNIRGPQVLRFLRHLARQVRGPVILVWDRGNPHKHQLVRAWLATHPRWETRVGRMEVADDDSGRESMGRERPLLRLHGRDAPT